MAMTREDVRAMDAVLEGAHIARERQNEQFERLPDRDDVDLGEQTLDDAFPPGVDAGCEPLGSRVLVQIRRAPTISRGGIHLAGTTQADIKWNQNVAKIIALGPLAFCNRETAAPWPEGAWARVGDFVRIPRWADKIVVAAPDGRGDVTIAILNDYELTAVVTGDPLKFRTYIL